MKVKYGRDQKIKGDLTENFDANYAFLEKALNRSGDIVKNILYNLFIDIIFKYIIFF